MDRRVGAEERIESIFELHRHIISIFFKDFEDTFELPEGLNFTHMKAAMMLSFHGPQTMSELSKMLLLEKGSFTPVAARIIKKGIVRKERSNEDKRVYKLALTESGKVLTRHFKDSHWNYIQATLEQLEPDEREGYFNSVSMLNSYNEKISGSPAAE